MADNTNDVFKLTGLNEYVWTSSECSYEYVPYRLVHNKSVLIYVMVSSITDDNDVDQHVGPHVA